MNAALMTKPTKALIAAATLSLITAAGAAAQDGPVALGAQATLPLSSYYANPPVGAVTLGGMPFSTDSAVDLSAGASASYSISYQNPTKVSLLLNTANTAWWYEGSPIGRVTLSFANGSTQGVDLVVGSNVREWAFGTDWTVDSLSDTANAANVWTGTRADDASVAAGLDMLTVQVASANTTSTLTGISVSNTNDWGSLELRLSGISVAYNPPATWARPGNSNTTPAAVNSQAPDHSSSPVFAGASTTTNTSSTCQPTNGDLQSNDHTGAKGNGNGGNGGQC
jgi:hypothetical protein